MWQVDPNSPNKFRIGTQTSPTVAPQWNWRVGSPPGTPIGTPGTGSTGGTGGTTGGTTQPTAWENWRNWYQQQLDQQSTVPSTIPANPNIDRMAMWRSRIGGPNPNAGYGQQMSEWNSARPYYNYQGSMPAYQASLDQWKASRPTGIAALAPAAPATPSTGT